MKVFIWRSDLHACGEIIVAGRAIHALRADGGQKHFSAASKKINKIYSEIESALNLTHMPVGAEEHSLQTMRELPELNLETAERWEFFRPKGEI